MDEFTRECKASKKQTEAFHAFHVRVLAAITLVVGMYFLCTKILIAEDGVLYIENARQIDDNVFGAMRLARVAPGYPFLICLIHKITGIFYLDQSIQGWIISAQVVSLVSKLLAVIALYFTGHYFVGARWSFWGVLVLSVLPDSVSYGSDVLNDWPSLLFLAMGILLLLSGAQYRKPWIFGCAGITAGLGYLIRPECGQVILYGSGWLLLNLVLPQDKLKRTKVAVALILLLAGFAVIAVPYMKTAGYVFPERRIWEFPELLSVGRCAIDTALDANLCLAGLSVGNIIRSQALMTNVCETLMYYFVPALLTGCYCYFRKQLKTREQTFFSAAFIVVNIIMALWVSNYLGFLSRRHTLPLVALSVFFVPIGSYKIAYWLSKKKFTDEPAAGKVACRWFVIMMVAGICICAVKLIRMAPLRWEKQGFRDTAEWLNKNTDPRDIIAVPDKRFTCYAERKGVKYTKKIPGQATYIVQIVEQPNQAALFSEQIEEIYSVPMNKHRECEKIVIYRVIR